jgi:hypothetical protein
VVTVAVVATVAATVATTVATTAVVAGLGLTVSTAVVARLGVHPAIIAGLGVASVVLGGRSGRSRAAELGGPGPVTVVVPAVVMPVVMAAAVVARLGLASAVGGVPHVRGWRVVTRRGVGGPGSERRGGDQCGGRGQDGDALHVHS